MLPFVISRVVDTMSGNITNNPMQTARLLFSPAETAQGSRLTTSELISIAQCKYPRKTCLPLKHWIIIDVLASTPDVDNIERAGLHPIIVYGQHADINKQMDTPNDINIVSDYLVTLEGCCFVTENTVYILIGDGFRQRLSSTLARALRAC